MVSAFALEPSDVHAERRLAATPEQAFAVIADLDRLQKLFPADCARWKEPFDGEGLAATAGVRYSAWWMRVRLRAVVKRVDAPRVLDLYHPENRGFTTRFEVRPESDGSRVSVTTFLRAPAWPFGKIYTRNVQPAWESCHVRTLDQLARQVEATRAP
jgi:hypothetical protein